MTRVSAAALAVACLLMGYSLAPNRVSASADAVHVRHLPPGISSGDRVRLTFSGPGKDGRVVDCVVRQQHDEWVGCGYANSGNLSSDEASATVWCDLTHVVVIEKIGQ